MFAMIGTRFDGSWQRICGGGLCLAWLVLAIAGPAQAQDLPRYPIDLARPQLDPQEPLLLLDPRIGTLPLLAARFSLVVSGAHQPLHYEIDGTQPLLVRDVLTASVGAALGLGPADLGVTMPIHLAVVGEQGGEPLQATAAGDLVVVPRVAPVPAGRFPLALILSVPVTCPTGDEAVYSGRAGFTAEPRIGVRIRPGPLAVALRAGVLYQGRGTLPGLADQGTLRAALGVDLGPAGQLRPELGFDGVLPFDAPELASGEILGGLVLRPVGGLSISAHGGVGLGPAPGIARGRLLVGIAWEGGGWSGPRDPDGDGIRGGRDGCPDVPEDLDGYQDQDGCPEADNDGDGIIDPADACPHRPGDTLTGCPAGTVDLDGDRVAGDECPVQPEDIDGFEDDDGCPDPDNDADQIPDHRDACPDRAEDGRGTAPDDGCPL